MNSINIQNEGVYFFLPVKNGNYYASMCIAQGLEELGIPFSTNLNNNDMKKGIEFPSSISSFSPLEASVCVIDVTPIDIDSLCLQEIHDEFRRIPAKRKIFISMADCNGGFYFADDMPLMATSECAFIKRPGKRFPLAFGLSRQIIKASEKRKPFNERNNSFLRNFRPSNFQHVRQIMDLSFVPNLEKTFEIDRFVDEKADRYLTSYFDRLNNSFGCLAYGGTFRENLLNNPILAGNPFYTNPEGASVFPSEFKFLKDIAVVRWDSWRFWESLAMGCVTVQLDFEKYGFMLPVMPENWKHYIGLDLKNLHLDIERIKDTKDSLHKIAENGRKWAIEHYSPKNTALRLIETVNSVF
ncbi:MAG: hypothetical protein KAJ75_09415 [Alphaproteobacteria bacterium]|nr:hypothetical protein [Alphaproteobacteria bacterium]